MDARDIAAVSVQTLTTNINIYWRRIAIPCHSIYDATKFALEGLSESIQYELEPFGIKIILIEPGAVGSNFWRDIKLLIKHHLILTPHMHNWQIICLKHLKKWKKM